MAKVLEFTAPTLMETKAIADNWSAEVIIFPGVRIERKEFNLAERVANVTGHGSALVAGKEKS